MTSAAGNVLAEHGDKVHIFRLVRHAKANAQKAARMTIPEGSFVPEDDGELKIDWNALFKDDEPKQ